MAVQEAAMMMTTALARRTAKSASSCRRLVECSSQTSFSSRVLRSEAKPVDMVTIVNRAVDMVGIVSRVVAMVGTVSRAVAMVEVTTTID